jgi:TetR/AcrR family transcriptional repressor of nem operon
MLRERMGTASMKVTRSQATENRNSILEKAGELFRERGFDGIGIADIMRAVGLTHGGFYGNFKSKQDLAAQACEASFTKSQALWRHIAEKSQEDAFGRLVAVYLSQAHRDNPGQGCPLTALAAESGRQESPVRSAFTAGIESYLAIMAKMLPGRSAEARRARALAALSQLVGAMVLARATDDGALSNEILAAARQNLAPARYGRKLDI